MLDALLDAGLIPHEEYLRRWDALWRDPPIPDLPRIAPEVVRQRLKNFLARYALTHRPEDILYDSDDPGRVFRLAYQESEQPDQVLEKFASATPRAAEAIKLLREEAKRQGATVHWSRTNDSSRLTEASRIELSPEIVARWAQPELRLVVVFAHELAHQQRPLPVIRRRPYKEYRSEFLIHVEQDEVIARVAGIRQAEALEARGLCKADDVLDPFDQTIRRVLNSPTFVGPPERNDFLLAAARNYYRHIFPDLAKAKWRREFRKLDSKELIAAFEGRSGKESADKVFETSEARKLLEEDDRFELTNYDSDLINEAIDSTSDFDVKARIRAYADARGIFR